MQLEIHHSHKLSYSSKLGLYEILGQINFDFSSLRITLHMKFENEPRKERIKIDLYDTGNVMKYAKRLSENLELSYPQLEADLLNLTDLLEQHREKQFEEEYGIKETKTVLLTIKEEKRAIEFLSGKHLLSNINQMLEETGIIGENDNRLLLFIIASSYKTQYPLHAIVQSSSGSGKSHLINAIAETMPKDETLSLSRITSKSLYHYREDDLTKKLILIQDMDGLDTEALYGIRELQSAGELSSSMSYKDRLGNLVSKVKTVKAKFASLSATTQSEIYFDNFSRSIIVKVDESSAQTKRIIEYQNSLMNGELNPLEEEDAKTLLSHSIRVLKPYTVTNPYANKIHLPIDSTLLRRLNFQFQYFINQLTILHQYQRKTDKLGRLITTKEDIKNAIEIFFECIWLKVDELDSSTRLFFEGIKQLIDNETIQNKFTQREVRQQLGLNKSKAFRYFKSLQKLEYIQIHSGTANKGYYYKITYWDDYVKQKSSIKEHLLNELKKA